MGAMQQEAPASVLPLNFDSADNSDDGNQPSQKPCQSVEILTAGACPRCELWSRKYHVVGPLYTGKYCLIYDCPTCCWEFVDVVFK